MEDSPEKMKNTGLDGSRCSRDLLQRFMEVTCGGPEKGAENDGEMELNLGLSMGGRFGVDRDSKKLVRSASVASCLHIVREDDAVAAPPSPVAISSLVRTSSLPVETEEEWKKRKDLQSMRRMEAKKRRSEKQRCSRGDKDAGAGAVGSKREEQYQAAAKSYYGRGIEVGMMKGKKCYPSSRGSLESQGGSSSSISEFESKVLQGSCELSPGSIRSLPEGRSQEAGSSTTKTSDLARKMPEAETETSSNKQRETTGLQAKKVGMAPVEEMPGVFTKGDGPNGKRIDGILYKYGKGEEVRIMCVCHGSFLSPAEFVKHAGGNDVAHPLKHIVINPNSSSFQ
ncbi:unnamed protein product [Cuscuta epithymum]|uniref:Ninja-family protein n=1 Tax=Cuscuta epithymum TaxID=186058 RepID=A0AAV0D7V7_9ASTE|nr:unnamed protein product [Cuscuta epithymum]